MGRGSAPQHGSRPGSVLSNRRHPVPARERPVCSVQPSEGVGAFSLVWFQYLNGVIPFGRSLMLFCPRCASDTPAAS